MASFLKHLKTIIKQKSNHQSYLVSLFKPQTPFPPTITSPLCRLLPYSQYLLPSSSNEWISFNHLDERGFFVSKMESWGLGLGLGLIEGRSGGEAGGGNVGGGKEVVGKSGGGDVVGGSGKEGEENKDEKERFMNWPNMISMGRLVSGPVLGWMILNEWYLPAFVGLAASGATDWLDGYVARKMGINSVVGSYLDPLADKVLIGCVALAMVQNDLLPSWLVGLVLFRDVGLIGGALYNRASSLDWQWKSWSEFTNLDGARPQKVEPFFISKVNTVFQMILVAAALLQPDLGTPETRVYITYLSWLVASTTTATTLAYGAKFISLRESQ